MLAFKIGVGDLTGRVVVVCACGSGLGTWVWLFLAASPRQLHRILSDLRR